MQSTVLLCFAMVACSYAQVYKIPGHDEHEFFKKLQFTRNVGGGQVFGGLGSNDAGLFGQGGYRHEIFNDQRGRFEGQAYGERTLGATGDSSVLGTKFNWNNANDNVRAGLDVHQELGGDSGATLTADGVWKVDTDTRLVAGGMVDKTFGHDKPTVGLNIQVEHDF